jgi:hypothetical protein
MGAMQPADIEPFAWRPAARCRAGVTFIVAVALVAAATGYLVGGGGKKTEDIVWPPQENAPALAQPLEKAQPAEVPRSRPEDNAHISQDPGRSNIPLRPPPLEEHATSKARHEAVGNQRTNERAAKPHEVRTYRELREYMLAR